MLSRQDDENILIMFSDNIHFWAEPKLLLSPAQPWEFIKLGNCGSPIETEAGWLVLSHGVGAMRKYCLGAFLLDLNDPTRVIGRLREPLLCPNEAEREAISSCGFPASPAVFINVLLVLDQLVLELLLQVNAFVAGLRQAVNGVHHEVKAVQSFSTVMSKGVVMVPSSL
jgi:hypothetical protein